MAFLVFSIVFFIISFHLYFFILICILSYYQQLPYNSLTTISPPRESYEYDVLLSFPCSTPLVPFVPSLLFFPIFFSFSHF